MTAAAAASFLNEHGEADDAAVAAAAARRGFFSLSLSKILGIRHRWKGEKKTLASFFSPRLEREASLAIIRSNLISGTVLLDG